MRIIAFLAVVCLLSACATTAPPAVAPPVLTTTPIAPSAQNNILSAAGRPNAPIVDAVTRALGAPDITRRDGAGTALTYRLDHCALLLIFTADAHNVMRLQEASPGPRRMGEAMPTLDQCVAEARARPAQR